MPNRTGDLKHIMSQVDQTERLPGSTTYQNTTSGTYAFLTHITDCLIHEA